MNIKVYTGKSMKEALLTAKKELGQEVVILESKPVLEKGIIRDRQRVQITVMADSPTMENRESPLETYNRNGHRASFNNVLQEGLLQVQPQMNQESLVLGNRIVDEVSLLREELQEMTRKFRHIISPDFPEPFSIIYEQLLNQGLTPDHAKSLVRRAFLKLDGKAHIQQEEVLETVKLELSRMFADLAAPPDMKEGQKVIALLGTTGVGKTTTLMKLASHPDTYGKKNVGILSIDSYRAGALAPLEAFSRIAGV
ncbi:hypothetical protein JYT44_03105, partial [Caldithrix abyssi]|nr:hypothetical protein [Caldithrix abyssi]